MNVKENTRSRAGEILIRTLSETQKSLNHFSRTSGERALLIFFGQYCLNCLIIFNWENII